MFPCTWKTSQNIATHFLIRIFYSFINHWQFWNDETSFYTWNLRWETFVQWTRTSSFGNAGLWGELNLKKHSVFGQKAWLGGGRSVIGVLHCFSSSVHGGLYSFGVLVCSATISCDCFSERNIINSWMQNKCGKLLQNQIMSFSAFSCAMLYLLFESLDEIAVAGWISFCGQLHEVWSTWRCSQTGVSVEHMWNRVVFSFVIQNASKLCEFPS